MVPTTVTFGRVHGLDLEVDVYTPSTPKGVRRPVVLMVHGGGFIAGDKTFISHVQVSCLTARGYIVVSPNYPLAPQSTIFDQIFAIHMIWNWIQRHPKAESGLAFTLGSEDSVDIERLFVWGGSAGGSLLIFSVPDLQPQPKGVVLFYPFVDLLRPAAMGIMDDLGLRNIPHSFFDKATPSALLSAVPQSSPTQGTPNDDISGLMAWQPGQPEHVFRNANCAYLYAATTAGEPQAFAAAVIGTSVQKKTVTERMRVESVDAFRLAQTAIYPPILVVQGIYDSLTPSKSIREWINTLEQAPHRHSPPQVGLIETDATTGRHLFDFNFHTDDEPGFGDSVGRALDFIDQLSALDVLPVVNLTEEVIDATKQAKQKQEAEP